MVSFRTMSLMPMPRSLTLVAISCLALGATPCLHGADLAQWIAGDGAINQAQAQGGSGIADGVVVHNSGTLPSRIELLAGGRGVLTLAPASEVVLHERSLHGSPELEIDLTAGKLQVNLQNKGRYAAVHVLSGNLDVRVTGTLFVVEHMAHDTAYLALIHGQVLVNARALGKATDTWLALASRQGIGIGADGLLPLDLLFSRPQVTTATDGVSTIRSQALLATSGSHQSTWHHDDATAAIMANALHAGTPAVVLAIVAQDPAAAADAFVSLNTSSPTVAKAFISMLAQKDATLTAHLLTTIAAADPSSASGALVAAVSADPSHAALFTGATIVGDPAHATDYAVAGVAAAPDQSAAIVSVSCQVDPKDAGAIKDVVAMITGGEITPAPATPPAATPLHTSSTSTSEFHLPATGDTGAAPAISVSGTDDSTADGSPLLNLESNLGLSAGDGTGTLAPYGGQALGGGGASTFISPQTVTVSPER